MIKNLPPGSLTLKKNAPLGFWIILILLTLLSIEGISFICLNVLANGNYFFNVPFIPSPDEIISSIDSQWLERFYSTTFDETLGWEPKPHTHGVKKNSLAQEWQWSINERGARHNKAFTADSTPAIAAFGDSYTFGDEVNDDQTWEYYLSLRINKYVANYGVSGYGPDQALLRYRKKLEEGLRPTVAVLGIHRSNSKRLLNRFRPFNYVNTGLKLGFKPRAIFDRTGALSFLPSVLQEPIWDRARLRDLIEVSRIDDFWAGYRPRKEFPYSANLLHGAWLKICRSNSWIPACSSWQEPDWDAPQIKALMNALIQEFVSISHTHHIQPVILFLSFKKRRPYGELVTELREYYQPKGIRIVDTTEADFDSSQMKIVPTRGHLTPYGNRAVAEYLSQFLP